ncbi:hypothetical protein KKG22_03140 [Patescibacteria group bacterium]|nr:hypothetical protein [Patescibacteria group bacterium]MBU1721427.1 hypothetical protein [Patescibacteria group bacterium]MBU1901580.1 hypothetical protein [Patescibacteria group bacterium]
MDKKVLQEELNFCLNMWEEKGGCTFGGGTKCQECASPYLLWKLIAGEVLHGDMERLSLADWREKEKSFVV